MNNSIPVYNADGSLYDRVSEAQLTRLESAGFISCIVRHRKGHVNRAILFGRADGPRATPAGAYMGTRYSTREHLSHGQAWELKPLGRGEEKTYAPPQSRAMFLTVIAECTVDRQGTDAEWPTQ